MRQRPLQDDKLRTNRLLCILGITLSTIVSIIMIWRWVYTGHFGRGGTDYVQVGPASSLHASRALHASHASHVSHASRASHAPHASHA